MSCRFGLCDGSGTIRLKHAAVFCRCHPDYVPANESGYKICDNCYHYQEFARCSCREAAMAKPDDGPDWCKL